MGLTERHWFENEEPELTEWQLEDIVYENKRAYDSGYAKGYSDRDKEIVRCKDCIHGELEPWNKSNHNYKCLKSEYEGCYDYHEGDWFCADGERRTD